MKHPLQFPGEGAYDPLKFVGLGSSEAVEAFQGDEDFVGSGV